MKVIYWIYLSFASSLVVPPALKPLSVTTTVHRGFILIKTSLHADTKEKQVAEEELFMADVKDLDSNNVPSLSTTGSTNTDSKSETNNSSNELFEAVKGAAWEAGKDLFGALRWGAAQALTAALPDTDRKELLKRLDVTSPDDDTTSNKNKDEKRKQDDDDDELLQKNSINEARAAAAAAESQRNASKWAKEKDRIMKQAEEAAKKRVETELMIQKQRLAEEQRRLEEEAAANRQKMEEEKRILKQQQEAALRKQQEAQEKEEQAVKKVAEEQKAIQKAAMLLKEEEKAIHELKRTEERLKKELEEFAEKANLQTWNATSVHPILGPCISDLGYKRIHLVSAEKLATIPVWKKQRIYRHDRAKAMYADKLKTLHLGLPGIICLHEEENGKLSILDGQHRVGMISLLQEKQTQNSAGSAAANTTQAAIANYMDLQKVLVEVYPVQPNVRNMDHAEDIFLEINKAEPIKLVDMPGTY
jgi:hypothetical protein